MKRLIAMLGCAVLVVVAPVLAQAPKADAQKKEAAAPKPKAMTAAGVVSAVSGNSLTVKEKTGDATFTVDNKTVVSGTGMGTKRKKLQEAGGKTTLSEFVKEGDTVSVTYHDMGGTKTASVVRIVKKKM